jgi:hypothetical protein
MPVRTNDVYGTYGSVPTAEPVDSTIPNPRLNVESNPNDFGAQIGGATQKLGGTLQNVAEQTNQYAIKLGDIYNQSSARDGVVSASQELSDAENEFKQNKGNNAVAAYKVFQQKAAGINEKYASSMPTNGAQLLFKNDFSHEVNGAIFRSGAYVADQAEQAQTASLNASMANNVNQFAMNANNPTRSGYLDKIQNDALQYAHHLGLDPDTADKLVSHNIGEAYSAAIKTNIESNPNLAKQLYDEGMNGSIPVNRDGQQISVPYLDAGHRSQISSEMGGEFRRQFGDQLQTSRMYASSGIDYNKDALAASAKNAGHSDDYINAEMIRLDQLMSKANVVNTRYGVEKSLDNAKSLASSGQPITDIPDPDKIKAAYPNEPDKARDVINEFHDQQHVAGFVAALPTTPISQIGAKLNEFKPKNTPVMSIADSIHQQESGGNVNPPANGVSTGSWQITPGTFSQYAKPGEDINNPKDNEAVGRRIIDDLSTKFNGDPARIAVGYFSGPGNVAPAGSKTPWVHDTQDANGKSVSSYVSDVTGRMQGSDFADQSRLYNKVKTATTNYMKKLSDDPAGTITGTDQNLTKLMKKLSDDPPGTITGTDQNLTNLLNDGIKDQSKIGPYIDAVNARQELLGIPKSSRAVLPASIATSWVTNITSNPSAAPDALSSLEQKTGSHWPEVYHSLVTQGGLPSNYQAIAHLNDDPETKQDAYQLAKFMGDKDTKGKDVASLLGGAKKQTEIKTSITSDPSVAQLQESLARSGQSREQIQGTINSIESLAYAKTLYNRDPQAAQKAADAFTKKYNFMTAGNARVPTQYYDAVNANANDLLLNLEKNGATVPPIYNNATHGTVMKPENYYDWVKNSPTWVTSPNEDSLMLKDPQDGWVRDKSGKPISVPFNKPAPVNQIDTWGTDEGP